MLPKFCFSPDAPNGSQRRRLRRAPARTRRARRFRSECTDVESLPFEDPCDESRWKKIEDRA
jgi:hypothetical protein